MRVLTHEIMNRYFYEALHELHPVWERDALHLKSKAVSPPPDADNISPEELVWRLGSWELHSCGWKVIDELRGILYDMDGKDEITAIMREHYPDMYAWPCYKMMMRCAECVHAYNQLGLTVSIKNSLSTFLPPLDSPCATVKVHLPPAINPELLDARVMQKAVSDTIQAALMDALEENESVRAMDLEPLYLELRDVTHECSIYKF